VNTLTTTFCLPCLAMTPPSLVPRPLSEKIEKGSGNTYYIAMSARTVQCAPIRLQSLATSC